MGEKKANDNLLRQVYEAVEDRRLRRQRERRQCVDDSQNQRWYDASVVTLQEVLMDIMGIYGDPLPFDPIEFATFPPPHITLNEWKSRKAIAPTDDSDKEEREH